MPLRKKDIRNHLYNGAKINYYIIILLQKNSIKGN